MLICILMICVQMMPKSVKGKTVMNENQKELSIDELIERDYEDNLDNVNNEDQKQRLDLYYKSLMALKANNNTNTNVTKNENYKVTTLDSVDLSEIISEESEKNSYEENIKEKEDSNDEDPYSVKYDQDHQILVPSDNTKPNLAIILDKNYKDSLTIANDKTKNKFLSYIQPIAESLEYKNGTLQLKGFPISYAQLENLDEPSIVPDINVDLLRSLYTLMLPFIIQKTIVSDDALVGVTISVPQICKWIGLSENYSNHSRDALIANLLQFQSLLGVITNPLSKKKEKFPVFLYVGENTVKNTVTFISPYLSRVISLITKNNYKRDSSGKIMFKKDGGPIALPKHSYLIHSDIAKEKNRKAVEIVYIIVQLIEDNPGNKEPSITAADIVEKTYYLYNSLVDATSIQAYNMFLKRAFTQAWKLLEDKTDLKIKYPSIEFPTENEYPTKSTLAKSKYIFKH